jgi:hypothetical protein
MRLAAVRVRVIIVLGLVALGSALGGRANAFETSQQDQNACMSDAQVYCGQFIPDRERVAHCLMAKRRLISVACRVALKNFK